MALQTKTFTEGGTSATKGYSIQLKLTEESTSVTGNTSVVSYQFSIHRQNSGVFTGPYYSWTISIGGKSIAINNFAFNIPTSGASSQVITSGKVTVTHDADGSKTMSFNVYTPSAENLAPTFGPPEIRLTGTWKLTTIPRASSVSAMNADIGSDTLITVSRASTAFTHTITYNFGSLSGTIATKTSSTSIPWTIPTTFYAQIPNAKYGNVTLTCETFSGSTSLGTKTATFRATASEKVCAPELSATVVDDNPVSVALTGDSSKMVRFVSNALCTISATAKNSASIVGKIIDGVLVSENSRVISGVDRDIITFAVTDSRGYTTIVNKSFELVPYVKLTANGTFTRKEPTSGNATISVKGNYFNSSFGAVDNTLEVQYRYWKQGESQGDFQLAEATIRDNSYSVTIDLTGIDYRSAYLGEVVVTDKAMTVSSAVSVTEGLPIFDFGKDSFRFHVPVVFRDGQELGDVILANIDPTLTQEDMGAEAKATGDAINAVLGELLKITPIYLTQAEYNALEESGQVVTDREYRIVEE